MNGKGGKLPINNCTSDWPETENQPGSLESLDHQFDDTEHILRKHFKEVIHRHHVVLAKKNQQIEELQEALARYRKQEDVDSQNTSQTTSSSDQDGVSVVQLESSTSEQRRPITNKKSFSKADMEAFREKGPHRATEYPIAANERFEKIKHFITDKERFGITDRQSNNNEYWNDKHVNTIQQLSDKPTIQHKIIDDKKLQGQTKTAVESHNIDEKRVIHSSLDVKSDELITDNEKMRTEYEGIAGLERLGQDFMRRLNFEEQLDKLYWQIEARRLFPDQQEYKMLVMTRNNLLESLRELKRKTLIDAKEGVANNSQITFKTLYRPSSPLDFSSDGEL